jgi:malate dehydrogenase (oxaloacetate-decarboxylating)(NADP+)
MKFAPRRHWRLSQGRVPDSVIRAYGGESIKFGREYIIPSLWIRAFSVGSTGGCRDAMKTGLSRASRSTSIEYRHSLPIDRARASRCATSSRIRQRTSGGKQRVVFAEGEGTEDHPCCVPDKEEGIATPILIGNPKTIEQQANNLWTRLSILRSSDNANSIIPQVRGAYYELP